MKKNILSVVLVFCVLFLNAQSSKSFPVQPFNTIEVHQNFKVVLAQSDNYSVMAEAPNGEILNHLDVQIENGALLIQAVKNNSSNKSKWSWRKNNVTVYGKSSNCRQCDEIELYITFPKLRLLEVNGAASVIGESPLALNNITIETTGASKVDLSIISEKLMIDQSGASKINLAANVVSALIDLSGSSDINIRFNQPLKSFFTDLSGASKMNVSGVCEDFKADCSGASKINGEQLNVTNANIHCSGASAIKLGTLSGLVVDASGASKIAYKEESVSPKTSIVKSGAASVSVY